MLRRLRPYGSKAMQHSSKGTMPQQRLCTQVRQRQVRRVGSSMMSSLISYENRIMFVDVVHFI